MQLVLVFFTPSRCAWPGDNIEISKTRTRLQQAVLLQDVRYRHFSQSSRKSSVMTCCSLHPECRWLYLSSFRARQFCCGLPIGNRTKFWGNGSDCILVKETDPSLGSKKPPNRLILLEAQ